MTQEHYHPCVKGESTKITVPTAPKKEKCPMKMSVSRKPLCIKALKRECLKWSMPPKIIISLYSGEWFSPREQLAYKKTRPSKIKWKREVERQRRATNVQARHSMSMCFPQDAGFQF